VIARRGGTAPTKAVGHEVGAQPLRRESDGGKGGPAFPDEAALSRLRVMLGSDRHTAQDSDL
jgi:hypothetical protein